MQTASEVCNRIVNNNRKIRELDKSKKRSANEIKVLQTDNEEIMAQYEENLNDQ